MVERGVSLVADATLGRSAGNASGVNHAIADKDLHRAVVQHDREVHLEDPLDFAQDGAGVFVKMQQFRRLIDSVLGGAVEVFSSRRRRVGDHRPSIGVL